MSDESGFQVPPGMVVITTYGSVRAETAQAYLAMQARAIKMGLNNIDFRFVIGTLVDKARNDAVKEMLIKENPKFEYLWFLDADMAFAPDLLDVMLKTAYDTSKEFDIIGGWCALRGKPYLPTIDTGTGTWEPHMAGQGPVEVIRTGGACVLIKRHVFERMEYPWFGVRAAPRAIDMMAEVDGYARQKFDGENPFWGEKWEQLMGCAQADAKPLTPANINAVGEDSNFTDKAKALGFRIIVQTNAVCGHIDKMIIWPQDHADEMKKVAASERKASGILE